MSTQICMGFSQSQDIGQAAFEACTQIKAKTKTNPIDICLIFASTHYAQNTCIELIQNTLKPRRLLGASSGSIITANGIFKRGLSILSISSTDIHIGASAMSQMNQGDLRLTGFELARRASQDMQEHPRQGGLIFSHPIAQNSASFIQGVQEALGGGFPIAGAISSADFKTRNASEFFQRQVLTNISSCLLWGGDVKTTISCHHHFKPLGKPRTITKSQGNIIYTIDDKPAVEIYEHYLPMEIPALRQNFLNSHAALYPLGILLEEERRYLLRNPVDILPDGSIVCLKDVPQGKPVHLMIANKGSCRHSITACVKDIQEALNNQKPRLIFVFQSMARQRVQGRSAVNELEIIKDAFGNDVPLMGMYTYGEIAPFGTMDASRKVYMQNGTVLMLAIT